MRATGSGVGDLASHAPGERMRDDGAPGQTLVDEAAFGRIFTGWMVDLASSIFSAPTLIVAG